MDLCATPATQLYYARASASAASTASAYASCVDTSTGEALAACLPANSPCRYSADEPSAVIVCVAYNSTGQCDREYMTDCGVVATVTASRDDSLAADVSTNLVLDSIASSQASAAGQDAGSTAGGSAASSPSSSTAATGITVDAPMLVAIVVGAIIVLGSILFMLFVVRSRRPSPGGPDARKSDSDTDFLEAASASASRASDELSPRSYELSSIVLPMRPTLLSQASAGSASSSRHLPPTPPSQALAMDEPPVLRFPSQASSFFRGSSAVLTGRSVFSAAVVNQGGAAVYAQRQLSGLFRGRASRSSAASAVQPIHSRSTAAAIGVTSPQLSETSRSSQQPLYSWGTPAAAAAEPGDGRMDSFQTRRGRAESAWSIGPGAASEASLGDFTLPARSPVAPASRLSAALEALPPPGMPSSLDDGDSISGSYGSGRFFDSGCTLFSNDSDYYGETIRDQSAAIAIAVASDDDDDDDDKEIEF